LVKSPHNFVGGEVLRAYITNTGRLLELLRPGVRGYCLRGSGGRTQARLIAVDEVFGPALIDTRLQEMAFASAVNNSLIPWLLGYRVVSRAPKALNSRFDYLLSNGSEEMIVELKSAVLRTGPGGELASYPDCVSLRGERHLRELRELGGSGRKVLVAFITTLHGVKGFTPYDKGDPKIRPLLKELIKAGGLVKALSIHYCPKDSTIRLGDTDLPVLL